jgi:sulfur-carrier protein
MYIRLPSILSYYTNGLSEIKLNGSTILDVVNKLDLQFPGIKFRFIDEHNCIRAHMKIFVNNYLISDLLTPVNSNDEIFIIQALSGG